MSPQSSLGASLPPWWICRMAFAPCAWAIRATSRRLGRSSSLYGVRLAFKGFAVGLHQRGGGDKQAEAAEAVLQKRALLVGNVAVFIRSKVRHGGDGEAVGNGGAVVEGVGLEDGVHFVSFLMERVDAFDNAH